MDWYRVLSTHCWWTDSPFPVLHSVASLAEGRQRSPTLLQLVPNASYFYPLPQSQLWQGSTHALSYVRAIQRLANELSTTSQVTSSCISCLCQLISSEYCLLSGEYCLQRRKGNMQYMNVIFNITSSKALLGLQCYVHT